MSTKRFIALTAAAAISLGSLAACSKDSNSGDKPSGTTSQTTTSDAPKNPDLTDAELISAILEAQQTNNTTSMTSIGDKDSETTGAVELKLSADGETFEGGIDFKFQSDADNKIIMVDMTMNMGMAPVSVNMFMDMTGDPAIVYANTNNTWAKQSIPLSEIEETLNNSQTSNIDVSDYLENMTDMEITEKDDRYVITGTPDVNALMKAIGGSSVGSNASFSDGKTSATLEVTKDDYSLISSEFTYDGTITVQGESAEMTMTVKVDATTDADVALEIPEQAKAAPESQIF